MENCSSSKSNSSDQYLENILGCVLFLILRVSYIYTGTSLVTQMVKRLPTMQETRIQSLGWEYPLEKEMATHSSILTWKVPWTQEPGGLQSMGVTRVRHNLVTKPHN